VFYWILVSRNAPIDRPVIESSFVSNAVRDNSGFLAFFVNTNLLNSLSMVREHAIVIVVGFFVSVESAGLFRLANQLATAVVRISDIFARPLFTELSRIYSSGDVAKLSSLFYRSLRMSAIAGAGIIVLLILLGKPFIELMAGSEFIAAYPLLIWMGGATGLRLMGLGLDPLLQASGKSHLSLGVGLAALAVIAIGLTVLLPAYGTVGAAITMFIAALATLIALLVIGLGVVKRMKST
jgi:O-antigen/teichoic acid export membrane protein